jgi:hypothetical protein
MAKKVEKVLKLQIVGGQANPAPPVGPALGQAGINIMEFCKAFNAKPRTKRARLFRLRLLCLQTSLLRSRQRLRLQQFFSKSRENQVRFRRTQP